MELNNEVKWTTELVPIIDINWSALYTLTKKCKVNAHTKYFHYQILHRSMITNKKLFLFRIKDNESCDRCPNLETIIHLLHTCPVVHNLWNELLVWLNRKLNITIYWDVISLILGNPQNDTLVNTIFLLTKHETFKSKCKNRISTIEYMKRILKDHMNTDIFLGTFKNQRARALGKWAQLYNELTLL